MKKLLRYSAPVYSIDISEDERAQAKKTREKFEDLLHLMERAFEHLHVLSDALAEIADSTQFIAMQKLFHQYKRKTKKLFNEMIEQLEKALLALHDTVSDSEMERIRDTILGEVREIRDGVIEILDFLETPGEKNFAKNFKDTVDRVTQRATSLEDIISEQLFKHLDEDVLGVVRLGSVEAGERGFYDVC